MKTKILFIRHGNSVANQEGFWGGQVDVDLTEKGSRQAQKLADFVAKNYPVDAIYASTLKRAVDTARPLADHLSKPVYTDKRLCEIYGGILDGMPYEEIDQKYPSVFALWKNDMSKVILPEGESVFDVQKRGFEAVCAIGNAHAGETVAIVTHRVLLRTLQCLWEHKPLSRINECAWIDNASVSEVDYENGNLIAVNVNQTDFLGTSKTETNTLL